MAYQSYSIPSSATLGCRFLQDEEKGKDAGICTAAVEPGGSADRAGIVVGMLVYGIHGDPVAGMEFNDVMQLVRKARSAHDAWTIELIHPINQPAEHSIRWATLLDEKGLNEFANVKGSDEGGGGLTGGLRRLSVAVGIKTHEEEPPKPVPLKLAGIGEGGERRASIASQGSDGGTPSSGRRASITAGSEGMGPTGPSGRRASIASQGSDGMPVNPGSGRRASISQGSDGTPVAPGSGRRASISMAAPPGPVGRRASISQGGGMPPPGRRASISQAPGLSTVADAHSTIIPVFDAGPQSIGKYRVLAKCTVREGKDGESTKVGEYSKGSILDVTEEAVNASGLAVVHTTTRTDSGAIGGWVKMRTAKGKMLLEKMQGVRSGRRMSVATIDSTGQAIAPEELIDVTFTGSGALGMLFEEIPKANGRAGKDIAIKKVVDGSIAADIVDVQVGLILRNVNKDAVAGLPYGGAMKMIGMQWRSADEMTLTFARPEVVSDSEEEEDELDNAETLPQVLPQGGKSPGGRQWVDGAQIEMMSSMDSGGGEQLEEEEADEEAEENGTEQDEATNFDQDKPEYAENAVIQESTPAPAAPAPVPALVPAPEPTFAAPPDVVAFMEENGAGEYAVKLCQSLGVTRVEDFMDLEDADYDPLNMKTIPKRRILKAVAAMTAAAAPVPAPATPEEAEPPAPVVVQQAPVPDLTEAPAEKPKPQVEASTKPLVNVYISPFLDQPETTVEMDRIRERMQALEGQSGRLKCMRADYTGWDIVETFDA